MLTIDEIMLSAYNIKVLKLKKFQVGAASDTYLIESETDKYILKHPCKNEINNPELEIQLCKFLLDNGIPVSEFVKNNNASYLTYIDGKTYHLQKYIEGINFGLNEAPEWLMRESAGVLGRIHNILADYPRLPVGIGEEFFLNMTPQRAIESYHNTMIIAENYGDIQTIEELRFRIELMKNFPYQAIQINELSCGNTHGDYFISQIIAKNNQIAGVIDWTTACVHPYVWEIFRSFVYAEPACKDGEIPIDKLISYVKEYLKYHKLKKIDIEMMPIVYYYQIAVCDYYAQYYYSNADNRDIFMNQARFSTKIMKWLSDNMQRLQEALKSI